MMQATEPIDSETIDRDYAYWAPRNLLVFAGGLYIPSAHGKQRFCDCMIDFQKEFFNLTGSSLIAVRQGTMPPIRRLWVERTKKAAKDSDLAICLLFTVGFAERPLFCPVCAANQDQASIVKKRAEDILEYNPWLNNYITIQQNLILGRHGSAVVKIEATGAAGAKQGPTPDLLVLNELVHVEKWGVIQAQMNNAAGVPQGMLIVSTNAGILGTPADKWKREAVSNPKRWKVLEFKGRAPWVDPEDVAEARRLDPIGAEHRRLWLGEWVSGRGGAVDDESIAKCFKLDGPIEEPEPGWQYLMGLDLGVSHDHAGLVLLGVNTSQQRLKVARLKGFVPILPNDRGQLEVNAIDVEQVAIQWWRDFHVLWFGYDRAAGGSFMAQEFRRLGMPMREMVFSSPKNLNDMATAFVLAMKGEKLECYDDAEGRLRRDFGKFSIVVRVPSGYKLEAVSDEYGHADVGTALVIVLPKAMAMLGGGGGLQEEDDMFDGAAEDPSEEDLATMPTGLREIYEMYDDEQNRGRREVVPHGGQNQQRNRFGSLDGDE
jgi:hypothetical protein